MAERTTPRASMTPPDARRPPNAGKPLTTIFAAGEAGAAIIIRPFILDDLMPFPREQTARCSVIETAMNEGARRPAQRRR